MREKFIRTMIEEKGHDGEVIEITVDGIEHFMEVEFILELIERCPDKEYRVIKDTFSKIDFANGDVMDYIKFLGKAFVKTYGIY